MIDKNFIIAMVAAMSLIISYNVYYQWRFGEYLEKQKVIETAKKQAGMGKTAAQNDTGVKPESSQDAAVPVPSNGKNLSPITPATTATAQSSGPDLSSAASQSGQHVRTISISTGVAQIAISTQGATLTRYALTKYHDASRNNIDLRFDPASLPEEDAANAWPTMGLMFPKKEFARHVNRAVFTVNEQESDIVLEQGDQPRQLVFELNDESGVHIRKTWTFYPGEYYFDFSIVVQSAPEWGEFDYSLVWYGLADEESAFSSFYSYNGPLAMVNKERVAEAPDEDEPVAEYKGEIKWAALAHRYFTMFSVPQTVSKDQVVRFRRIDDSTSTVEWGLKASLSQAPVKLRFFVGPKEHRLLDKYGDGIKTIINYGWFDIIARPLFWVMNHFHQWTGNWGWSLIMLTVVTKILFFPLTQKGFKSMQKLQKLQPQLKRLQEAYKDDKEKLNQEMMTFYKDNKVNPVGGCLPMILQIPIFFALYKVLLESIELKGAEWILWIKDLSMSDPYYVTPVLMGISMLAQQMMTPQTGDPMQRKLMMGLPVVFTFMFLNFPAGLVIYWFVNNILTIGQQWLIRRQAT